MIPVRTFRRAAPEPQKQILYPAGTDLKDVPPLARGITEMEYLDRCIEQWKKQSLPIAARPAETVPAFGRRSRR